MAFPSRNLGSRGCEIRQKFSITATRGPRGDEKSVFQLNRRKWDFGSAFGSANYVRDEIWPFLSSKTHKISQTVTGGSSAIPALWPAFRGVSSGWDLSSGWDVSSPQALCPAHEENDGVGLPGASGDDAGPLVGTSGRRTGSRSLTGGRAKHKPSIQIPLGTFPENGL